MKRREAIRNLSLSIGGMISLPAWASEGWNVATVQLNNTTFTNPELVILTDIVEAIIPESNTLGAKSVGVPAFIQKMLADCYEPASIENVKKGFESLENTAKTTLKQSFTALTLSKKQEMLLVIEQGTDANQKEFYGLLKNLTILGYTTSEYVQTTFLNYNMAPGHYYGCVPVKAN